ncbi:hypothetical protein HG530_006003 [Fusarium avenaceum]|nr:hypothetical protein HG530_006003 [Fusarium avenaceum]
MDSVSTYVVVEVLAVGGGNNDTGADTEVTKALAVVLLKSLVQTLSVVTTTQVHVVSTVRLTDESNLCQPGTSTTVGATSHTHDNGVLAEAVLLKARLELGNEHRQVSLRLGHGKTTGGESDTGGRAETEGRELNIVELVLLHELLDVGEVLISDVAKDEMLVTGKTELRLALERLGNLTQTSLHLELRGILDTTVLDEECEVVETVLILLPAEGIDVALELERSLGLELLAPKLLDLAAEDRHGHVVDGVLETGVLSVLTITVVTLDKHDLLTGNVHILGLDETEHATSLGICLLVVVGSTHATTSKKVEASKVAILTLDSNQTNVVGIHIGIVMGRNSNSDLELSGKVSRTVQRLKVLDGVTSNLGLLVVIVSQPDLVVGGS